MGYMIITLLQIVRRVCQ